LEGDIKRQLRQFAMDTHADLMILGSPSSGTLKTTFSGEEIIRFIRELEREGNLRIIQVVNSDRIED